MRTVILFGLAAGMMTSAAVAEPLKLDDEQMDSTTAGVLALGDVNVGIGVDLTNVTNIPTNVGVITSAAQAINVLSSGPATATIVDIIGQGNFVPPTVP
jgi:hypothetical protein